MIGGVGGFSTVGGMVAGGVDGFWTEGGVVVGGVEVVEQAGKVVWGTKTLDPDGVTHWVPPGTNCTL